MDIIYLKDEQGNLIELREKPYDSEDIFQKLLENYPTLLSSQSDKKWTLIKREMEVPDSDGNTKQYFLDHFFVNADAMPILVEVKRSSDTRIRREVVGQMLDYAVNASLYWDIDIIRKNYEECNPSISEIYNIDNQDDLFWQTLANNLKLGKMKLIFVADKIPDSLLHIIEFLNNQMTNTEVLGIEIRQFIEEGNKQILVPKIVGNTIQANIVKKAEKGQWDRNSFLEDVKRIGEKANRIIAEKILDDMEKLNCRLWYGKGKKHASVVFCYDFNLNGKEISHQFMSIYPWIKGVHIELDFQYFKAPFNTYEQKLEVKNKLEKALNIHIPEDKLNGRPTYSLEILADNKKYKDFLEVIQWMLNAIEDNSKN